MRLFARGSKDGHFSHEMISSYLDGALRAKEMEDIDLHLASCDACRQEADELRAVVDVLRAMPTVPAPAALPSRCRLLKLGLRSPLVHGGLPHRWRAYGPRQWLPLWRWLLSLPETFPGALGHPLIFRFK